MLWTFPTYSTPDVALLTFLLTVSSRGKARAAGKIAADATAGPDGSLPPYKGVFAYWQSWYNKLGWAFAGGVL
jgi:hypothetical protein